MKKLAIALIALALFACGVLVGWYQTFPFRFISDTAMWATGNKGFDYYSDRKTLIETSERTAAVVMLGDFDHCAMRLAAASARRRCHQSRHQQR